MPGTDEKAAAPILPVGADREQPIHKTTDSIAADSTENNPQEQSLEEKYRQIQRMNDPAYLHTVTMRELYENVYQSRPSVIDGLLNAGTYLLAGAPKVGKSFLVAQLAYHVCTGLPLWNYAIHKGTVLYLALVLHPARNNSLRIQRFLLYFIKNGIGGCRYATLRCDPDG